MSIFLILKSAIIITLLLCFAVFVVGVFLLMISILREIFRNNAYTLDATPPKILGREPRGTPIGWITHNLVGVKCISIFRNKGEDGAYIEAFYEKSRFLGRRLIKVWWIMLALGICLVALEILRVVICAVPN